MCENVVVDPVIEVLGIFQGGGAKGFAYIGALRACERYGIKFKAVAGTSAGAITAALVAAGATSSDLLDISNDGPATGCLADEDLVYQFFERGDFNELKQLKDRIEKRLRPDDVAPEPGRIAKWAIKKFAEGVPEQLLYATLDIVKNHSETLRKIYDRGGVLRTEKFKVWMSKQLSQFVDNGTQGENLTFRDLPNLTVIAANVHTQSLVHYSVEKHPDKSVVDAVVESVSIPIAFFPAGLERDMADGGLVSNFPAWVFDTINQKSVLEQQPEFRPIIGFRLVPPRVERERGEFRFIDHLQDIVNTALAGNETLETREVPNLIPIDVPTGLNVFDFHISVERRVSEAEAAEKAVFNQLTASPLGPRSAERVDELLSKFRDALLNQINGLRDGSARVDHLRINVMRMFRGRLAIFHQAGMRCAEGKLDHDFAIELLPGTGACGIAFESKKQVAVDLRNAQVDPERFTEEYRLTERQQALVKDGLTSLLSTPLINPLVALGGGNRENSRIPEGHDVLGVLNVDSTNDILDELESCSETIAGFARLVENVLFDGGKP